MPALAAVLSGAVPAAAEAAREPVRITSPATLYSAPDEASRRIAVLPAAFAARWLYCANGWVRIEARMGGKQATGYVKANQTDWPHRC